MSGSRARVPGPRLASAVEGRTVRDMRPVPVSPIRFGDTLAADVAAARPLSLEEAHAVFEKASRVGPLFGSRESPKPRMRATPIWAALAFGVAAWVVLAGVVYAAWTWL